VQDADLVVQHLIAVFSLSGYPYRRDTCLDQAMNWMNSIRLGQRTPAQQKDATNLSIRAFPDKF